MNRTSLLCGVAIAAAFLLMHTLVGFIPVGGGAGWDGGVYVQYIELLGQGKPILGDPYRSIRMSGFLPLVVASNLGASKDWLILIQACINACVLSIGAAMLHDTMLRLGVQKKVATLSIGILSCSWMFLCMPMFYPVLSDHIALAMVCVCLWCWVRSIEWAVYVFCAFFTWLMPGLFLIPLILAIFPYVKNHQELGIKFDKKGAIALFVLFAVPLSCLMLVMIYHIPLAEVAKHSVSANGKTASIDVILLSACSMLLSLLLIVWLGSRLAIDGRTWKCVSVTGLLKGCLFFIASATVMKYSFDWTAGFAGPPLLNYLFYQSLAAPFKPLVAHFISFGPVILLAIYGCISAIRSFQHSVPKAIEIVFVAFLPLLAFGSESRQWIGILPIAVIIFALADYSWLTRVWCLLVSFLVLLPVLWLKSNIALAAGNGLGFQTFQWQFYFGRQGPWMSLSIYQIGLLVAFGFIIIALRLQQYRKPELPGLPSV